MKNIFTILISFAFANVVVGQHAIYSYDFNNVNAVVANGGTLFQNTGLASPGYEIPKGSENHALYNMSFWYAGQDLTGELRGSFTTYSGETELFPGALSDDGAAETSPLAGPNLIYPILKSEIDNHIANWDEPGYVIPENIINWPAHGDISLEQDFYLAPFMDTDGDGIYQPENGDYPIMRGDFATYMIMNDKRDIHAESGASPIGIEVHQMVYSYATDDYLNNTIFIHTRLINRSTISLSTFKTGAFIDADLGNSIDDFVGVNVENNIAFAYNGTNTDSEYGENPPAIGIVSLNNDISAFVAYNDAHHAQQLPTIASQFYMNLNGKWQDDSFFTYGGTGHAGDTPTSCIYPGDPNDPEEWSEISVENVPGERRMMMAHSFDGLLPNEELCLDYAVVYNRDGDHLENVQGVIDLAGEVKTFFDGTGYSCDLGTLGLQDEIKTVDFNLFPNPSNGTFTINTEGEYNIEIMNMAGQIVHQEYNLNNTSHVQTNLAEGVYLLKVMQNGISSLQRLVITAK